jgi:Ca-activated chloride channel family protein
MINYFSYAYPEPSGDRPFAVSTEVAAAPWHPAHQLVRVGIKGKHVAPNHRPRANLVFLIDVSGSMQSPQKLPLLKRGFTMLAEQLDAGDRVSIVTYAGASGLVLPPTAGDRQGKILQAIAELEAGGSTNGASGIHLAYEQAQRARIPGGVNRVVLATDGDFNVGTTNQSELVELIEDKRKQGTFLSVLGFGRGNYKDSTLEKLADKGNGNYSYIDSVNEARKVLVEQAAGTLITIAKDVKIQVEFNPTKVAGYRLIGYENRKLSHRDFADDKKDAGDIGAGHTVTALYEVVPVGHPVPGAASSELRYQRPAQPTAEAHSDELVTVKLRYKTPRGKRSTEVAYLVHDVDRPFYSASADFRFAASVAELGMLLRGSEHRGSANYAHVLDIARGAEQGDDRRRELVTLARLAKDLAG